MHCKDNENAWSDMSAQSRTNGNCSSFSQVRLHVCRHQGVQGALSVNRCAPREMPSPERLCTSKKSPWSACASAPGAGDADAAGDGPCAEAGACAGPAALPPSFDAASAAVAAAALSDAVSSADCACAWPPSCAAAAASTSGICDGVASPLPFWRGFEIEWWYISFPAARRETYRHEQRVCYQFLDARGHRRRLKAAHTAGNRADGA